ncbi:hypothetical protein [Nocardioides sp. Soil805]|uniref:hypothetical protein n=1 Tax=Nocardioides sp. Soil805 TaxID=1736416 RepID=UPI00070296DC|nr:hypothetical protein [Nocardioides sp. Soil805]KRF37403.1 hypothetical protein ASG94_08760 [Nocardioides sp. Soil805]
MAVFTSRCTNGGLSAVSREDPMYETRWHGRSTAKWLFREEADAEHERSRTAYPPGTIRDKDQARGLVADHPAIAAATIGALAVHATLSVEQVAAFVGIEADDLIASGVLQALWSMGAVAFGHVTNVWDRSWARTLWTINDKSVIATHVLPLLSGAEALAMNAGQAIHLSQGHHRHALLAAELALRIAEFTPVGTVLGERLTELKSLFGTHTTRRGDLTAVREDGLRIVLEVVAHDNQEFGQKADFWAEQLATPRRGYGMTMVVFVVAADPKSSASRARGLGGRVSAAIVKARAKHGATWRGHDRMGLVSWEDWFPAAGEMSPAFSSLTVRFPESRLTHASVLDAAIVPCAHPGDREYVAVIENTSLLAQTPAWLRSHARAQVVLHRMGLPRLSDVPSPPLAKPKRPRSTSKGCGAAGQAKLPPRLLGPPGEHVDARATIALQPPAPPPPSQSPPSTPTVVRRRQPRRPTAATQEPVSPI